MGWIETFLDKHPDLRPFADLIVVPPDEDEAIEEFPELTEERNLLDRGNELIMHYANGRGVTRLAHYTICRRKGEGHSFAVMFALQSGPRVSTDDTFWSGRKKFWQVYGEDYANDVRKKLAARGMNIGENSEYMPELARFRGDPEAVIPTHAARGHIRDVCEKRGWTCEGSVNVKGRGPESDPLAPENCVGMADDLVRENAVRMIKKNPDLKRKTKGELRKLVLDKHGPSQ